MDMTQTRELLGAALAGIAPEADLATVRDDEDLREALDLDSMDFQNLVIDLSARLGWPIPEADVPQLYTLRGMQAWLDGRAKRA